MFGRQAIFAAILSMLAFGVASAQTMPAKPVIMPGPEPDYARPDHWLCRPGNMAICSPNLDATSIATSGKLRVERFKAASHPKLDCFYVYPTASRDPASNSDLIPGDQSLEEIPTVQAQLAQMARVCRLFAPMYRSRTTTALSGRMPPGDRKMAYDDVAAAWAYYLAHDNGGRGVVLVGHSQGSGVLRELIRNEIDGKPAQKLLVSALLAGTDVAVPPGKDVGGDFKAVPLCGSATQTGCVVPWNSYRASAPPPANAVLGGRRKDGLVNACVNPAMPGGGEAMLHPYLRTRWANPPDPIRWTTSGQAISTDYVRLPGLLSGRCVQDEHGGYLAVILHADAKDGRIDDFRGDIVNGGVVSREWGLHMIDVDLVMGDMIELVRKQGDAWQKQGRK